MPGERWADRLVEAAAATVEAGRGVLAIVPDQRDVDTLQEASVRLVDDSRVVALSAGLGPSQRYRRWLSVLRGSARLVIGTRSAVFAPVADLGLVLVWDDGDDTLAEPRAPYPHAREVAMLRAHQLRCAAMIGGYSRTAEAQALVRSRWAHDLVAARPAVRSRAPRVVALEDSGYAQERDPAAHSARLPSMALQAARSALDAGHPVLVQVPRRGYVPALACGRCRTIARCRHCTGPLSLPDRDAQGAICRWCGREEPALRCARCGSEAVRAVVVGARRTAEELGRAFPGTTVVTSGGDTVISAVPADPALVVATPGAEPVAASGYGAALLLDAWALLGRQDLRATEDTLRRWMAAATLVRSHSDGGVVAVVAESTVSTVQALIRWDPVGHAEGELVPATRSACRRLCTWRPSTANHRRSRRCWKPPKCPTPPSFWPRRPAIRGPQTPRHPRLRLGQPNAGPGAPPTGSSWPRHCGGPPGCSARVMISSRFGCKSTHSTLVNWVLLRFQQ